MGLILYLCTNLQLMQVVKDPPINALPDLTYEELVNSIVLQTAKKKNDVLIYAFQKLISNPYKRRYAKRIAKIKVEGRPQFERYVFDYGKPEAKHIIDWDILIRQTGTFTINLTSDCDVSHLL